MSKEVRKDLHTLFDRGYITVDKNLHVVVSKRIKKDYGNGREYYAFHGRELVGVPEKLVEQALDNGHLWPEPLIQLNPSFEPGGTIEELVSRGILHPECSQIFRLDKGTQPGGITMQLHKHQTEAVETAYKKENYVLTTGTGSGKSLAYIIPIVDHIVRRGSGKGIQAIIIYPMNALVNSQYGELEKFLCLGYPEGHPPVTFEKYTGQESDDRKQQIIAHPPDILITNYVMIAQQAAGENLAGKWEFPGGKIEPGETPQECLKREIREELDVDIEVLDFFGESIHEYDSGEIRLMAFCCKWISGDFCLHVHSRIEWVNSAQLEQYAFAPADIPLVQKLKSVIAWGF